MKHYVIATQQPWGIKAFYSLPYDNGHWTMVGDEAWLEPTIDHVKARYAFFLNWSAIVPPEILALTECVNFHCTALPCGRGGAPAAIHATNWASVFFPLL